MKAEIANKAAEDPTTTILIGVWPTPRTKNAGTDPSRVATVKSATKDRTPMFANSERDFRNPGPLSGEAPLEARLPLAT